MCHGYVGSQTDTSVCVSLKPTHEPIMLAGNERCGGCLKVADLFVFIHHDSREPPDNFLPFIRPCTLKECLSRWTPVAPNLSVARICPSTFLVQPPSARNWKPVNNSNYSVLYIQMYNCRSPYHITKTVGIFLVSSLKKPGLDAVEKQTCVYVVTPRHIQVASSERASYMYAVRHNPAHVGAIIQHRAPVTHYPSRNPETSVWVLSYSVLDCSWQ